MTQRKREPLGLRRRSGAEPDAYLETDMGEPLMSDRQPSPRGGAPGGVVMDMAEVGGAHVSIHGTCRCRRRDGVVSAGLRITLEQHLEWFAMQGRDLRIRTPERYERLWERAREAGL